MSELRGSNDRIGYVIASSNTVEKAIEICENAINVIVVKILL